MSDGYWVVVARVFAMDSRAEAEAYRDKLIDAYTAMPESAGYAGSWSVEYVTEEPAPAPRAEGGEK